MWAEKEGPEQQVKWQPTAGGDTSEETQPNALQYDQQLQNEHHENHHHLPVQTHNNISLEIFDTVLISKTKLEHFKLNKKGTKD